jgi:(1->4)-alpha-D-glucan 1-alpha-D-glucosylmutase
MAEAPVESWAIEFIARMLASEDSRVAAKRLNQLTAPVAAKAVEDTAFYRYGRLLSRNDVGFQPGRLALEPDEFHQAMVERARDYPHAMLATATHDHKRGEDHRARLAVLSELPHQWANAVEAWRESNRAVRPDGIAPDDEYQLYQTLVGAWPLALREDDAEGLTDFRDRIAGWRIKSLREAKLRTSWAAPDQACEDSNMAFLDAMLDPARSPAFLTGLRGFADRIAPAGALNGLTQLILRCTLPGMPDMYQGSEFWDFSLVDPDNRRPVDYPARIAAFEAETPLAELSRSWRDGRIKQNLAARLLDLRRKHPDLFANGDYRPLEVEGQRRDHVVAFARRRGSRELIVAVPIRCAVPLTGSDGIIPPGSWWGDTCIAHELGASGAVDCLGESADIPATNSIRLAEMKSAPALIFMR